MAKKEQKTSPKREAIFALDPVAASIAEDYEKSEYNAEEKMSKSETNPTTSDQSHLGIILKSLRMHSEQQQQRMAFEIDPHSNKTAFGAIYRHKIGLTPDHILKRIAGPQGDDLVNQILQARSNIISSFGRPRTSRFDIGFEFQEINQEDEDINEDEVETEKNRVERMKEIMWNCGFRGLDEDWHPNLGQFMKMITRDGLTYGRFAVERIYAVDPNTQKEMLHSFRPVDAGTIFRIIPSQSRDKTRRKQALALLEQIKNKKFDTEKYDKDEYKWVQAINGNPVQLFTDKELVVYNLYPTTNVEFNGYPLTPIDQALNAIATHINITLHNKLFFEHGRAARGMLVFKSDDIDQNTIQRIRLQFHQSINSVQNSWRMPVFAVGSEDDVSWQSIDVSGRDKEFQFLSDDNARVILGAFQISPEELPGYAHLSRGTNTQALSESDNEYQLTAARDVGLRPLMYDIQDFFNSHIIPLFDKELSKSHQMVLAGLEHDSPEREAQRLGQDAALHMTYDEILEQVEKKLIGPEMGGRFPLNQQWQMAVAPYLTVGQIMENFFGVKDASKDPRFNYFRDPFYLQWQQLLMQKAQMAMQQQMAMMQAQQQQQMGAPPAGGGEGEGQEGEGQEEQGSGEMPPQDQAPPQGASEEEAAQVQQENAQKREAWMKANYERLNKNINHNHSVLSKMILKRHAEIADRQMEEWRKDSQQAIEKIVRATKGELEE